MGITVVVGANFANVARLAEYLTTAGKRKVYHDDIFDWERMGNKGDMDCFYLIGDCDRGMQDIALSPSGKPIPSKDLVDQLIKDGLPNKAMDFHVWACFSGDGMQNRRGAAYNIWRRFAERRYTQYRVWGYRKALLDPYTATEHPAAAEKAGLGPGTLMRVTDTEFYRNRARKMTEAQMAAVSDMVILPGKDHHWSVGVSGSLANMTIHPPEPLPRPSTPTI